MIDFIFIILIILSHTSFDISYLLLPLLISLSAVSNSEYIILSLFFYTNANCIPGHTHLLYQYVFSKHNF